jgi:hypothetical protein
MLRNTPMADFGAERYVRSRGNVGGGRKTPTELI